MMHITTWAVVIERSRTCVHSKTLILLCLDSSKLRKHDYEWIHLDDESLEHIFVIWYHYIVKNDTHRGLLFSEKFAYCSFKRR